MPRRPKLVTQYLESIHRDAFEDHPDLIRSLVHRRNGIYALFRKDDLYYVGLARDLRWRLKHHLKDRHKDLWDRFSVFLTIGDRHLRELESLVIRITRPAGNKQIGRFSGAENLDRMFREMWDKKHRRELDLMMGHTVEVEASDNNHRKLQKSRSLRGWYKKKTHRARLKRDGTVRLTKKIYSSLSAAATAVCGHPTNGRWFWHAERSPGDWIKIRDL